METELTLSIGGFPPLSGRECQQILKPIEQGALRRTINGDLVHIGASLPQKYYSIITGKDKVCLATEGLQRGTMVTVGCLQRLSQKATNGLCILERDPMEGSVGALTADQRRVPIVEIIEKQVTLAQDNREEEVYVTYRPVLKMRVVSFELITHEWGISSSWRLILEEV